MSWETVKLGDVCSKIGSGATPRGGSTVYIEKGITFIRSQNVYNLSFNYSGLVFINDEAATKLKGVTIKESDVLLNITGDSVARTCIVPSDVLPARVNQHVAIVRPKSEILNPIFLNYYLASPYMQSFMLGIAVGKGTSRNAMTKDMIAEFEVPCPPIKVQQKIIDILKPYDSLIENNRKQIKLLEEAAQRLYKEWFVNLHFPGYEDVEIVAGVPEGWTEGTLEDVAPFKRGKTITKVQVHDGDVPVVAGGLEPAYYHNVSNTVAPVITVSGSGANAGYARLYNVNVFASDCSFVDSNSTPYLFYVYCFIKDNKDRFNALKKGSAQPHVYAKDINALEALIPTNKLIEEFCSIASQYFEKIKILQMQIQLSTQARDRLLPKLMSGEIEV